MCQKLILITKVQKMADEKNCFKEQMCEGVKLNQNSEKEVSNLTDRQKELEYLLVPERKRSAYSKDKWEPTEIEIQEQERKTLALSRATEEGLQHRTAWGGGRAEGAACPEFPI